MKRIANKVAVETLLYTIPSDCKVRIVDVDHHYHVSNTIWEEVDDSIGKIYTVGEIMYKLDNVRVAKAQIHRTAVNGGVLLLVIDTKHEEY